MPPLSSAVRKRPSAPPSNDAAARLAAHGEAFMRRLGGSSAPKKRRLAAPPPAPEPSSQAAKAGRPAALLADAVDALFARPPKSAAPKPVAASRASAPAVEVAVFDGRRVERYAAGTVPPPPPPPRAVAAVAAPGSAAEDAVLAAAFQAMQKEVEAFGAAGLDARQRKAWEVKRLAALGMSAPKRPRIPASIGLGMAAKQVRLKETARLEAAVLGGRLAKKAKPESAHKAAGSFKARREDRGLAWGGGLGGDSFRNGTLRLRDKPSAPAEAGGRSGRAFDGVFGGKGSARVKALGGEGKGKGKGKSKGKR